MIDFDVFKPTDINHIRIFLTLFCSSLTVLLLVSLRQQWLFFNSRPAIIYSPPKPVLNRITLPQLNLFQFQLISIILIISLITAALGILPRLFILLALIFYFPYFGHIMHLEDVRRKTNLIPVILLILLVSPSIDASWLQPVPQWPLLLVKIALIQMYVSAAFQKLQRTGIRWANGRCLQAYLVEQYLWGDTENALRLAKKPLLCALASAMVLLFQLTIWMILFWPEMTIYYVLAGLIFHLGTAISMHINYIKYLTPVYMVFATDCAAQLFELK